MSTKLPRDLGPTDAELVRRVRDDDTAFATLYDRYADRIHAFCFSRLRNDGDSADALQETFVNAHWRLDQLDDPAKFRPWLFAIARNTIVDIARARGRHDRRRNWGPLVGGRTPTDPHRLDLAADIVEPDRAMIAAESAELLWDAASALHPRDQELLELHLREGLDGGDLARAMDIEPAHVSVMVKRMKTRLSTTVGSLLVARLGRDDCTDLDAILTNWSGRFSLTVRSSITRHVASCETCDETRRAAIAWETIAAAMPAAPAPTAVRLAVMTAIADGVLGVGGAAPAAAIASPRSDPIDVEEASDRPVDAELPEPTQPPEGGDGIGSFTATESGRGPVFATVTKVLVIAIAMTGALLAWPVLRDDTSPDVTVKDADEVPPEVAGTSETGSGSDDPDSVADATTAPTTPSTTTTTPLPPTPGIFFGETKPIEFPTGVVVVDYTFGNVGGTPMSWAASSAAPFSVSFQKGTLFPGETFTLELTFDVSQSSNDYVGRLDLNSDGGDFDITLLVFAPPSISLDCTVDSVIACS